MELPRDVACWRQRLPRPSRGEHSCLSALRQRATRHSIRAINSLWCASRRTRGANQRGLRIQTRSQAGLLIQRLGVQDSAIGHRESFLNASMVRHTSGRERVRGGGQRALTYGLLSAKPTRKRHKIKAVAPRVGLEPTTCGLTGLVARRTAPFGVSGRDLTPSPASFAGGSVRS
jgi:hypothetical protein